MSLVRNYISDNNFLVAMLNQSNLSHLYKEKKHSDVLNMYREDFNKHHPHAPKGAGEFHSLQAHLQKHFSDDFFDFFLFLTDARRVQPVFRDITNFHKYGPSALPDHMLHAGNFTWSEDPNIELTLVVRGLGKSVYLVAQAIHNLTKNIYDKSLYIQDKIDQSTRSLNLIKTLVTSKALALVYPHIFKSSIEEYRGDGSIFRRQELDLKPAGFLYAELDTTNAGMFRKESSYAASSVNTSEVGVHVGKIFADDIVNQQTPKNEAEAQSQIEFFSALDGLEEYEETGNGIAYKLVGTTWRGPGLYEHIMEKEGASVFSLPIEYTYKETQYYIAPIFDAKKVSKKVTALGTWSDSQLYMKCKEFSNEKLDLGFDKDTHVITLTENEVETFKKIGVVVQTCDPSYSKNNKKDGDNKSRFTILHTIMTRDTMFIFDAYSSLGERTDPTITLNRDLAIKHTTDVFIQDAQGTQESLYKDVRDEIWRKHDATVTCIPYKKGSNFNGMTGKADIANGVLRSLIVEGKLKVIVTEENKERIQIVIDQLSGADKGFDVVDCVVMTKVGIPDLKKELQTAVNRKKRGVGVGMCLKPGTVARNNQQLLRR